MCIVIFNVKQNQYFHRRQMFLIKKSESYTRRPASFRFLLNPGNLLFFCLWLFYWRCRHELYSCRFRFLPINLSLQEAPQVLNWIFIRWTTGSSRHSVIFAPDCFLYHCLRRVFFQKVAAVCWLHFDSTCCSITSRSPADSWVKLVHVSTNDPTTRPSSWKSVLRYFASI